MEADRLIAAAEKALRIATPMRRQAFLDMLVCSLDLAPREAAEALHALADDDLIVIRGYGTSALVYPRPKLGA